MNSVRIQSEFSQNTEITLMWSRSVLLIEGATIGQWFRPFTLGLVRKEVWRKVWSADDSWQYDDDDDHPLTN